MIGYLLIFIYLTFLGGTVYTDMNFGLRVAHHLLISGLLAVWLVRLWRRREPWPWTGLEWPLALLTGVRFFSSLLGADPRMGVEFFWRPLTHLLLFYWLVWLLRSNRKTRVLRAYFLVFGVVCLVGMIEYAGWYFGLPFLPIFEQGWPAIGGLRDPIPPNNWRLNFTLSSATSLSTYLALLIPPAMAMAIQTRKRDMRIGWWLLVGGALLVQLLTGSRGGLIGLLVAAAVAAMAYVMADRERVQVWWKRLARSKFFWIGCAIAVAGVVIVAVTLLIGYGGRPENLFARIEMWECAVQTTARYPLFGIGTGGFGLAWRTCAQTSGLKFDLYTTAHNLYLNLAAESGLLGILAFLLVAGAVLSRARARWDASETRQDRAEVIAIVASLAGYAVNMIFDALTATPLVLPVIFLVAWLVAPLEERAPATPRRRPAPTPALALAALLFYLGGLLWIDLGQWHFEQAVAAADRGEYAAAVESLERAQAIDPALTLYDFQQAYYLGQLATRDPARYLAAAIAAQEAALRLEDTSSLHWGNLAALRWQNGDRETAIGVMEQALKRVPAEPALWLNYGLMAEELGRPQQALEAYAEALAKKPQWADSGFWAETNLRRESFEEIVLQAVAKDASPADLWLAAGDYERVLAAVEEPLEKDEFTARGHAYVRLGALEEAQRELARALDLCPDCVEAHLDRSVIYWQLGRRQDAEREARTALFISSSLGARAHQTLAWIALQDGDVDGAIDHLQRAVPPQGDDYNWEAVLYNRRGDLGLLPQLVQIEGGTDFFAPWLELADLYLSLDRPGDAAEVYRVIVARDPFVPGVADRPVSTQSGN